MGSLFEVLDREWMEQCSTAAAAAALARWRQRHGHLPAGNLADLVSICHDRSQPEQADRILASLVALAPSDVLATRTVFAALTPALKSVARTYRWLGKEEAEAAVIAAAWERIRTYPSTRPRRIAANIALDVRKRLSARSRREEREAGVRQLLSVVAAGASYEDDVVGVVVRDVQRGALTASEASFEIAVRLR